MGRIIVAITAAVGRIRGIHPRAHPQQVRTAHLWHDAIMCAGGNLREAIVIARDTRRRWGGLGADGQRAVEAVVEARRSVDELGHVQRDHAGRIARIERRLGLD